MTRPKRFYDSYFSKEHRYSIGTDATSGRRYLSIPVSSSAADYEEYYSITPTECQQFFSDPSAAIEFAESCRRREQDDRLIQQPGWNRGTPR